VRFGLIQPEFDRIGEPEVIVTVRVLLFALVARLFRPSLGRRARGAGRFAVAVDKNQTPINKEAKRTGANFTTIDNPIGDKRL
jgi:hypothetical protein